MGLKPGLSAPIVGIPSNRGLLRRESPLPEPCVGFLLHCYSDPDMEYGLEAEEELAPHSIAGEEDPLEALDHDAAEVSGKGKAP
jgi:hypothetical protein